MDTASVLTCVLQMTLVHCSFVIGKVRVTRQKPVTIPRLKLTAALLSERISASLQEELEYDQITEVSYTDSQVVLSYNYQERHSTLSRLCGQPVATNSRHQRPRSVEIHQDQ